MGIAKLKASAVGFIARREADYIQLLLGHPGPRGKEAGLERLCAHYRSGRLLRDSHNICQSLTGLLYDPDENVRRWAFNAIALVGTREQNLDATIDALNRNRGNEDVFAAGVSALVALTDPQSVQAEIKRAGLEVEGPVLLAAAQYGPGFYDRLRDVTVDPDFASATELRLATVLVGLDKAPENLFSPKYANGDVLGSFHTHGDRQVAQYAAWAAYEHPQLGLSNLGFRPTEIRDQVPDVRKYGARLLATDDASVAQHSALIDELTHDPEPKVREGLASGLLRSYSPGFEATTARWYTRETDRASKEALIEHFVANAGRCDLYRDIAIEEYKAAPQGAMLRAKLEARAEGSDIYREFRRLDLQDTSLELFGEERGKVGGTTVNNNTFNINAQNVGVVGATNEVSGGVTQSANQTFQTATNLVDDLIRLLPEDGKVASEGRAIAEAAKAAPSKGAFEKVLGWMENTKKAASLVVATSKDFSAILDGLQDVLTSL